MQNIFFRKALGIIAVAVTFVAFPACGSDNDNYEPSSNGVTMRLKTITHNTESGMLTYDDAGRIMQFTWDGHSITYSYKGATIEAIYKWSDGSSSRTIFTLDKGVIVKKTLWDKYGNLNEEYDYSYKNNRLSGINMNKGDNEYTFDYVWEGNNLKQLETFYNGKAYDKSIWKYNGIKTHPLIHALFGFYAYEDAGASPYLLDLACVLPVYNNFGVLPTNLFSECTYFDFVENKEWNYTMSYNMDGGNVVEIVVTNVKYKKRDIYHLTWEETSGIDNVKADKASGKVQTISGMNTGRKANDLKEFPKGVYIVDGKKIVKSK